MWISDAHVAITMPYAAGTRFLSLLTWVSIKAAVVILLYKNNPIPAYWHNETSLTTILMHMY
jgi:hypothetical protein